MRLLQIGSRGELSLTKDLNGDTPSYAILSHTWGADNDEVTFNDLKDGLDKTKAGYAKIQFCGEQARKDGLQYFWVDTCCIDKANNAGLAEAIVSMFRWYSNAAKCYVFLSDVSARQRDHQGAQVVWESAFRKSKWFTRGWTLQELLAPDSVDFFSKEGERLGDKRTLEQIIHEITTISKDALRGAPLPQFPVPERLRWAEKRHTTRMEDKAYCLLGIFDVFMLPMYGEGENAFDRLKDEIGTSYRRQLDVIGHMFATSKTTSFEKHDTESTSINAGNASRYGRRRILLTSRSFDPMDSRRSTIKTAYSTTCHWLLKHPAYSEWIDPNQIHQHYGFLWINGKPGAGKSTLVKFAYAYADRERPEHEILISFFFNARGDELERSTVGMYRALLYQLLSKAADMQSLLDDFGSAKDRSQRPVWTTELLCEFWSLAIAKLGQRRLKVFIDALDECDEQQIKDMIIFFEQLGQNALQNGSQLYVCFASRHYPTIDIRSGRQLILEDEYGHGEDLAKYIQSHLRAGEGKDVEEVRTQIWEKANGIFMWVVLVVDILNKEFLRGRKFAVKKRLQEIPAKLSEIFTDILRRDCENMTDLLLCLQWILFAKRPLKREEFYFAMVAGLDPEPENMTEWDPERISADDMTRFVLSSSKGLAELTKSKTPTVQFIHESVRDFLLKENGLRELWPEIGTDLYSLSHDQLKGCCQNYLNVDMSRYISSNWPLPSASLNSTKDLRRVLTAKFPFLAYATRHVLYHADEATGGVPQEAFLRDFPLNTWLDFSNLLEWDDIRRHTPNASLLYILAENNFTRLIRTACHHGPTMGAPGERYHYPIFAALANGHRDAVRALFKQDEKPPTEDIVAQLEIGRAFSARKDHTPLLWALEKGHRGLAEILVSFPDIDLSLRDPDGRCALSLAAREGYEALVKLLLATDGVVISSTDKHHRTPLSYAAREGRKGVARLLLDNNADINSADDDHRTPLSYAAHYGHIGVVRLLLDKNADVNSTDEDHRTPLSYAAQQGEIGVVELLLDKNADTEAADDSGKTALVYAAKRQDAKIVELLVAKGANIEVQDKDGRTPLSYAAEIRDKPTVQLLLTHNASVSIEDCSGKTPLLWLMEDISLSSYTSPFTATTAFQNHTLQDYHLQFMLLEQQNKTRLMIARPEAKLFGASAQADLEIPPDNRAEIVQLLLAKDSKLNAKGTHGKTALIVAAERGWDAIAQLLLDKNADIEAKDSNGMTALIWAATCGRETVVQLLLDKNANIEAEDNDGRTALLWAAENVREEVVQLLLDKNANIEAEDNDGRTALLWAAENDSETTMKSLFDDYDGRTALLWAAENDSETTMQPLFDDYDGRTALLRAASGRETIVQLLRAASAG